MDAQVGRDTSACAPTVAPATEATHCPQGRVQSLVGFGTFSALLKHAGHRSGSSKQRQSGKARGRIWDLGGRPMYRRRSLPAPLSRAQIGVRLQPAPAAAPSDQPYHPDLGRLVCRSRSGPLRAGTPPSHHDGGDGIPSVLALMRAWDATPGLRRFRGQNKGACEVVIGSLAVSLGSQQPFPSCPIFGRVEIPGPNHAMEKKEGFDGRCILPLGPQSRSAVRQRRGFRLYPGTHPARGRQNVHNPYEGVFHNLPSLRGIGFACEEFRR